jgi:hypothetical protein
MGARFHNPRVPRGRKWHSRGGRTIRGINVDEEWAASQAGREATQKGFTGTFDQLDAYLARA